MGINNQKGASKWPFKAFKEFAELHDRSFSLQVSSFVRFGNNYHLEGDGYGQ